MILTINYSLSVPAYTQWPARVFRGCWLPATRVSDTSPRGSAREGAHHPQLLLLEDLPAYSQLREFALLGFMRLFTCLILNRCFKALLTWSCGMVRAALLGFCLTKCTHGDRHCCVGVTMCISWQISTETACKIPQIKIHIFVRR